MNGHRKDTVLVTEGRFPERHGGTVNMPIYRASTICFRTFAELEAARAEPLTRISYGLYGTPNVRAFEQAVATLEGGSRAFAVGSGLAAIAAAVMAFVGAGDHILVVDTVYGPARRTFDSLLTRYGVETTYYDPALNRDISKLFRPNTKLVYAESPGSQTFEIQDVRALASATRSAGIMLVLDNTWGTPFGFASFTHGVDVSLHAATKTICGHSDVMLGVIVAAEPHVNTVREHLAVTGLGGNPDDCYLALRGLRSLGTRLRQHTANALVVARWLEAQAEVERVLYPPLPGSPGHDLWKRDFTAASGLLSLRLKPFSKAAVIGMVESLRLFGLGASWGGFESLVLPAYPAPVRAATAYDATRPLVRLHVGLEDPADLIDDLNRGFEILRREGR